MRRTTKTRGLFVPLLSLLLALACAETGADPSGFPGGAGGGSEASGFGAVGNGGTSTGFNGAGAGGESSGFTSNAAEGGTQAGMTASGGGGAWVCSDLCEFAVDCAAQDAAAQSAGRYEQDYYGQYGEQDGAMPNASVAAMQMEVCMAYCGCLVTEVPGLSTAIDQALDHVTCDYDYDDANEAEMEQAAASVDEEALEQAYYKCYHELSEEYGGISVGLDFLF